MESNNILSSDILQKEAKTIFEENIEPYLKNNTSSMEIIQKNLSDLKRLIVEDGVLLIKTSSGDNTFSEELLWDLTDFLPDFDISSAYTQRLSAIAIAAAVIIGWLLGGVLSSLLDLINLGGDILRVAAIFIVVWSEEYISSNTSFRNRLLKSFGWISLTGFAAKLSTGLFRFSGGIRNYIFGSLKPGFFKGIWLIFGACILFVFFSKKASRLNLVRLKSLLTTQISERLQFIYFILYYISEITKKLNEINNESQNSKKYCPKNDCVLVKSLIEVIDSIPPNPRQFILDRLKQIGFSIDSTESNTFIWNSDFHSQMYNPIGFIKDGDKCIVLKPPITKDGTIIKGQAQAYNI